MSAPMPPLSPPPKARTSTSTIVIAVAVALVLGITGAGLAGWAAWSLVHNGADGGPTAAPPEPSTSARAPSYPGDLARFYEQDLAWRSCGRNQCSRLTVPLDYAKPEGKVITLAVLRVPAQRRAARVGQLVVDPGGPGASAMQYAAGGAQVFGAQVARYFDVVGLDPRGVGESTPLKCADTAQKDEFLSVDPDPDTPAEVARLDRLTQAFGEGCLARSGDLVRHMSTVEVAKDMDVLREALGERKLDYFGASYGTLIGAIYADLFPTHVRRMVLDGAVDPALSSRQLALNQAHGFEIALRAYLRDCVDRGDCVLGNSVDAGTARIAALLRQLDENPLPTSGPRRLTEGLASYGIVWPLYVKEYWPLLTVALRQALRGDGTALLLLADQYADRGPSHYTSNLIEALYAVNCLDHGDYISSSQAAGQVADFEKASPTFGRTFAYGLSSCATWPVKSGTVTHKVTAAGAPPIVVVGTTRDPATPYEQSVALARELQSGVLISRDGDGHTGFQQGNKCVDRAIEAYLIGGKVPQDGLSC